MSNKSEELAEMLFKITLDLYRLREPCAVDQLRGMFGHRSYSVHEQASMGVFDVIRIAIEEDEGPGLLQHYNIGHLLLTLPLYAIYRITPIVGVRVGTFLAELAVLRSDVSFNFNAWSNKNLLSILNASQSIRAEIAVMRQEIFQEAEDEQRNALSRRTTPFS